MISTGKILGIGIRNSNQTFLVTGEDIQKHQQHEAALSQLIREIKSSGSVELKSSFSYKHACKLMNIVEQQ